MCTRGIYQSHNQEAEGSVILMVWAKVHFLLLLIDQERCVPSFPPLHRLGEPRHLRKC